MKLLLFLSIFLSVFSVNPPDEQLAIGSKIPMPEKKMKATDNTDVSFSDVKKENGLLVIFSCNTCPWVIKNQKVAAEGMQYAAQNNIGVIILNSNQAQREKEDSPAKMKEYSAAQNYQWPYAIDENSAMADAFGARVTPECFLFDKEMKLVYHGAITDNPKTPGESTRYHLKQAIDETVTGKKVSMQISKAMGCGIKRKS
ncbi:MAG: redoxin family protein [Lacibacter sp.]